MEYLQPILYELGLKSYVAIDIETTGLDYLKDEIIEVAAVRFTDGQAGERFETLIRPHIPIPENIVGITGITDEMVADAPAFSEVAEELLDFVGNDPLVAHNVPFDIPFIEYNLRRAKNREGIGQKVQHYIYLKNDLLDTLQLAKILFPFVEGFSLEKLVQFFQIEQKKAHRALDDALAAGELFLHLVVRAMKVDFRDVRTILRILEPVQEPVKYFFEKIQLLMASGRYHLPETPAEDAFYFSANYYNIIGEDETPTTGKLEVEPLDVEEILNTFQADGQLGKNFSLYEVRQPQIEMAEKTARAFNNSEYLVVEAGTGTGKSMAYLLPAVKWSVKNYGPLGRVIISTNTKNLQEQLFFKDIPILHSVLKEKFKAVLLKGKSNYLCLDKWQTVLSDMSNQLTDWERVQLLPLVLWAKYTTTGDIAENAAFALERNFSLWRKLIAENNYCPGKSCKYYNDCFLWRARNHARNAHLVLVNHSLLFSDIATDQAVLSEYANVIIDEAHNIEKVATEYLGHSVSIWDFREPLRRLYFREKYATGVLKQMQKWIPSGALESSETEPLLNQVGKCIDLVNRNWQIVQAFFQQLTAILKQDFANALDSPYSPRVRYNKESGLFSRMRDAYLELDERLRELMNELNSLIESLKLLKEDSFKYQRQTSQDLQAQFSSLDSVKNTLELLLTAEWDDFVYWFEIIKRDYHEECRLYAAPLNVAELLYHKLYRPLRTAIFASATLTVGKSFNYFIKRVGLDLVESERLKTLLLDTPFEYERQVLLAVPTFFPEPREITYREQLEKFLHQLTDEQRRGILVLFTAYGMLNELYNRLKLPFQSKKITLLAQGKSGGRHQIINRFKQQRDSVLFGTDSFWEGVDVPGSALEILLITKLPFDVPSDPIIEAKAEKIDREGGNSFMDFTVPEAVIKFRQGFGRLIRTRSDFGAVIITDRRVVSKQYGRMFLHSLPVRASIFQSEDELWEALLHFFEKRVKEGK
ncbi:MAG: helicase C-terminal domain-containing protein [Calditrichia bacterium]